MVDIGHRAHQGVDATKRQLRVRLWFPGMYRAVERRVSTRPTCQASMESRARDPRKPTKVLEEPLSRQYTDHWGPTQDGQHIRAVINGLTRYPKVVVVKGTSADNNIKAFSEISDLLHSQHQSKDQPKDTKNKPRLGGLHVKTRLANLVKDLLRTVMLGIIKTVDRLHVYLLADPRLAEALNYSTVVPRTGSVRSSTKL